MSQSKPEQPLDLDKFHPSQYMRARRPHLFSDTKAIERPQLDRDVFDHYLETLTSRKQELDFEHFARRLAEKELCPNLVPQTGPTGGGDSKVDTETYPVAAEIADRWYLGRPQAAQEAWGFAFSTKKKWKAKLQLDVASIISTNRGYKRVYFITSQYVKDKDRGDTQDELRHKYGLDIHILDRQWIIEKVFGNKREQLAIDTFGLERPFAPNTIRGPRDTGREADLQELETQIDDSSRYTGIEYQLVEDCLETALLARGLERPRIEVDGRFERAQRIAKEYGTGQQQLRVAYNRAWTLFWWYEDYASFTAAYDDVERLAKDSSQIDDIELLKNIWQLLHGATRTQEIDSEEAKLDERTATLAQALHRLAEDKDRPTTALEAQAQQLLMDLVQNPQDQRWREQVFAAFERVFEQSKGLVDFPTQQLIEVLTALGEFIKDDPSFDAVFEQVVNLAQERESQATAGRMLLKRGIQLSQLQKPYEAIRCLGRAQQRLALRECREEFVAALAACGQAFEATGLLWAAHASALLAASQALREFLEDGTVTRQAYACVRRLAWLDLQLGRPPFVLAWIETAGALYKAIALDDKAHKAAQEEWTQLDFALGLLLLRTDFFDLKLITKLGTALDRFGLHVTWIVLLYILGHEDRLRTDKIFPAADDSEKVRSLFAEGAKLAEANDLPSRAEFLDKQKVTLRSLVLGCEITVTTSNNDRSLFFAESILAALEAFLATSLDAPLLPYAPKLAVNVIPTDFLKNALEWEIVENDARIDVRHTTNDEDPQQFHDLLPQLLIAITTRIALPTEIAYFEKLFRDEEAMSRAMCIASVGRSTKNILGNKPKMRISDWIEEAGEAFPLRRTVPWNAGTAPTPSIKKPTTFGTGNPPAELVNAEKHKHRDRRIVSLIDIPLWDKAGWKGTGYVEHPDQRVPPLMALLFKYEAVGLQIFTGLRRELGIKDKTGRLRVSIITGIDRDNSAHYRIVIGSNLDWNSLPEGAHVVTVTRIQTMTPDTSANLDRFLSKYRRDGAYFLAPGHVEQDATTPDFEPQLAILTSHLNVRPAWEIAENDPDLSGIREDDNVIIPDGITDAPILKTIKRIEERREYAKPHPKWDAAAKKVGRNDLCPCRSGKKYKKCHGR